MDPVEEFIKSYPTQRTQQTYRSALKKYFEIIKADPNKYFKQKRNYTEDFKKFWNNWLIHQTPCTRVSYSATINVFLQDNDMTLSSKEIKKLKRKVKGRYPITIDRIPTQTELKQILRHGNVKEKTLFLFLLSSGMRINEVLQLTKNDIDLKTNPATIMVRAEYTKLKQKRICFITEETKNYLIEWLKIRDQYLQSAVTKTRGCIKNKKKDDNTIFCYSYTLVSKMWNRLLRDSGFNQIDPQTKVHQYHIHTLRKFFKTNMIHSGVQEAIINQIIGHSGYLDKSYLRFTEKDLREGYKQGMQSLSVFDYVPVGIDEKMKEVEELKKTVAVMQEQISKLVLEMQKK